MRRRYSIPKVNGRWPRRSLHLVPGLIGANAFENDLVVGFWYYMMYNYKPRYDTVLITPCSNVKPYPLSPMNRKIIGILRRHKLWDEERRRPLIEWLFLSDLLGFVPYTHTWIPPACCYDAPPDIVENNRELFQRVLNVTTHTWNRIKTFYSNVIIYLPRKYYKILPVTENDKEIINIVEVKYNLFNTKELDQIISLISSG